MEVKSLEWEVENWIHLAQDRDKQCCEHGDGQSWEYLDLLKNYQLLKKNS